MAAARLVARDIEKLKQVLIHDAVAHLFSDEVEKLDNHLRLFKALSKRSRDHKLPRELIRRISDAVYEAKVATDAYITKKYPVNDPDPVKIVRTIVDEIEAVLEGIEVPLEEIIRYIDSQKTSKKLSVASTARRGRIIALVIEKLIDIIRCTYRSDSDDDSDVEDGGIAQINQVRLLMVKQRNKKAVGIDSEVEVLSRRLIQESTYGMKLLSRCFMKESTELEVLPIIVMAGFGKTILAQKIFHDIRIVHHFPIRIWVYVSKAFTPKEIFLHILKELNLLTDGINTKTDKELADLVVGFLKNKRFLIVMDNLWRPEHWDELRVALPTSNKKGRVLITSRVVEVGTYVNSSRRPHTSFVCSSREELEMPMKDLSNIPKGFKPLKVLNVEPINFNLKQNVVVGMEGETEKLSTNLMVESDLLRVLSIVGMAGLGKTVLAHKIFHDARIVQHFPIRIWVYVSRKFTPKEIFVRILNYFTLLTDDIKSKTDKGLADLVVSFLENERFLLVMDDLWSPEDWDRLKVALPMSNKKGRVLMTSRSTEVGHYVNRFEYPHKMSFLSLDESYQLLQLEAFRGQRLLPPELQLEGRRIAHGCRGHPLAIVLIGGILFKEFSSDMQTMKAAWTRVSNNLTPNIISYDPMERMTRIIAMSYEKLPYHLRECFLYFGMFPEDFEIPVWKLIRLWIAEGFIQQRSYESLETSAENYLQELIDRNIVRGVRFKLNGEVKTCRVHDMILDFCIAKAASDCVFQQIKMSDDGSFEPSVYEELKFRRLCIHSNALTFFSRKPVGPSISSFICSSREEMEMPMKDLSTIPKGFKLLEVLDVEPINFNLKLPRDLFQLSHLKYLFLSVKFNVLPSAFTQLLNMQTLIFYTSTRTLDIRADILNLTQLRHFKTKASAALRETSTRTGSLTSTSRENFQTLGNISPESCTKDLFERTPNLKKLGVRGNLGLLLDGEKESFDSLGKLEILEKLKLLNDVFPIPPLGFPVLSLPPSYKFPPKLKILTLSRTCLDWRHMSIIRSLENLEVLKLEDKSFVGDTWEAIDGGFHCLEVLRIERVNLKNWLTFDNQFPKLKHLQLRYCDDLQRIPFELANVPSFWKLELFHCKRAAASAREIEAKIKHDMQPREFNLSISPFNFKFFDEAVRVNDLPKKVEGKKKKLVENLGVDSAKMANMSNRVLMHLRRQYNRLTKVIMESTAERVEIEALLREFQDGQLHVDEEEGPSGAKDVEGHEVVPDSEEEDVDAE